MAHLLGWKDILRPIRDGYRHLFPTPDTGPTPEQRRRQRELDRLKGFAYFDTFDQLELWTEADSDPLQRANTPLLRGTGGNATDHLGKAPVLLIHDYSGNYHDYESVQAPSVDTEFYSCEYLQFVDTFVYFSHKLVCVPPPTWTNTLHRNGVEVLGTFLIELQTEGSERLLQHTIDEYGEVQFSMARKLACIATHYGFDGWLVNIEKPFPNEVWNAETLEAFLRQLKVELGVDKRLIWYDALTTSNKVSYQNQVNRFNLGFAKACGGILTNYCWTETDVSESIKWSMYGGFLGQFRRPLPDGQIYFGVDVWAQNKSSFSHPRVTYPGSGGGGTNTGVAVAKLAQDGLLVGVFAPAWSFEHFPGHGRDVERTVWEGAALPKEIDCSCGDCASRHPSNKELSILRTAKERPAGSEHFFYTNFSRAFRKHGDDEAKDESDGSKMHAQLGRQSVLPRPAILGPDSGAVTLSHRIESEHDSHMLVITATQDRPNNDEKIEEYLPLYKLDMPADGSLLLSTVLSTTAPPYTTPQTKDTVISIYFKTTEATHYIPLPLPSDPSKLVDQVPKACIRELGVHLKGPWSSPLGEPMQLIGIREICISRVGGSRSNFLGRHDLAITQVRLEERGEGEQEHVRLCWNFETAAGLGSWESTGIPYSDITGPFAYFDIRAPGLLLARAYALEHILDEESVRRCAGEEIEIEILGFGFDGWTLAEAKAKLRL